jgi:hypothetical protein
MDFKVHTTDIYNCPLERAFKSPILCDVTKVHTGYGMMLENARRRRREANHFFMNKKQLIAIKYPIYHLTKLIEPFKSCRINSPLIDRDTPFNTQL